jgi:hypothetical protein
MRESDEEIELWFEDEQQYVNCLVTYRCNADGSGLTVTDIERLDTNMSVVLTSDLQQKAWGILWDRLECGETDIPDMEWTREWE